MHQENSIKILLIDDCSIFRIALMLELMDFGFIVESRGTYEAGRTALLTQDYDIMITDLHLDNGNSGINLICLLKEYSPESPAIVITAWGTEVDRIKAFDAGADGFMVKGFFIEELVVKIFEVVSDMAVDRVENTSSLQE